MANMSIYDVSSRSKSVYDYETFKAFAEAKYNEAQYSEVEYSGYKYGFYRELTEEEQMRKLMKDGQDACEKLIEEVSNLKWLIKNFDGTPVEIQVIKASQTKVKEAYQDLFSMAIK